jgi:hypothetical protein
MCRLSRLYGSTATLLTFTATAAETAAGSDLGKEALRILAERLCAVCHMREAVHSQGRIAESAAKAQQLSIKCSQPAPPPATAVGSKAAAAGAGSQPSPDDSTTSSQDVVAGAARQRLAAVANASTSAPAAAPAHGGALPSAESMQRLLEHAKQVARFSSLMRRSPLGFQTFIERHDYRGSQAAKLVSMHIAAVSMDMGMVDGFRLLSHASRARACIASLPH